MSMTQALAIRRLPVRLTCDPRHTITRFFWLGSIRARKIIDRVMSLSDEQAANLLTTIGTDFGHFGEELNDIFLKHYEEAARRVVMPESMSVEQKRLIGAYFTMEYSFASAALFNPSITPARSQHGVEPGSLKFIMSLRCVGEGHISSIMFRRGLVDADGNVTIEPGGPYREPKRWIEKRLLSKPDSRAKLAELGVREVVLDAIFNRLDNPFTMQDLRTVLYRAQDVEGLWIHDEEHRNIDSLSTCDYNVEMFPDGGMNHIVLFPMCEAESRGMEDMRLIRFTHDDGSMCYYGTYTAFNGWQIRVQLVEIPRPDLACIRTLHGRCVRDKGLALFPRKIQGKYMMSGRLDGENLYILHSNNIRIWDDAVMVQEPKHAWEFVQIGNCGSPIETEAGWLLLTHGVGPMRRYCIGATLLDLNDPTKIIGRLDEPLLMPGADERHGYVPNVVYSCGSLVHNGNLVIPYGISDAATGFATVPIDGLLGRLC